jgi:hypothetical protein
MNNWIYGIIENLLYNNLVEDEDLENISEKELDNLIKKTYNYIVDDSDLETELVRLIEECGEWHYYHNVKEKEN